MRGAAPSCRMSRAGLRTGPVDPCLSAIVIPTSVGVFWCPDFGQCLDQVIHVRGCKFNGGLDRQSQCGHRSNGIYHQAPQCFPFFSDGFLFRCQTGESLPGIFGSAYMPMPADPFSRPASWLVFLRPRIFFYLPGMLSGTYHFQPGGFDPGGHDLKFFSGSPAVAQSPDFFPSWLTWETALPILTLKPDCCAAPGEKATSKVCAIKKVLS